MYEENRNNKTHLFILNMCLTCAHKMIIITSQLQYIYIIRKLDAQVWSYLDIQNPKILDAITAISSTIFL